MANRICYLLIPAADPQVAAAFYGGAFGWNIREHANGALAFDAPAGISGRFVTGRPPSREPGILVYIMVEDIQRSIAAVLAHGGTLVAGPADTGGGAPAATMRDPYGNAFGLYQEAR